MGFYPVADRLVPMHHLHWSRTQRQWRHTRPYDPATIQDASTLPDNIKLVTWNVEAFSTEPRERLAAALDYLRRDVLGNDIKTHPCAVLLQEVAASAFRAITDDAWVRASFFVLPASPADWLAGYGVVTLVSRAVRIAGATSLEYGGSQMGRTALMADVLVRAGPAPGIFRIVNTHLESCPTGGRRRRDQMRAVAGWLGDCRIMGGIAGGDMNALAAADGAMVKEFGLKDAWDLRPQGSQETGETWGFQPPHKKLKPGRLDKFLYKERRAYEVTRPFLIGEGEKTSSGLWVSDHFGLSTHVRIFEEEAWAVLYRRRVGAGTQATSLFRDERKSQNSNRIL